MSDDSDSCSVSVTNHQNYLQQLFTKFNKKGHTIVYNSQYRAIDQSIEPLSINHNAIVNTQ